MRDKNTDIIPEGFQRCGLIPFMNLLKKQDNMDDIIKKLGNFIKFSDEFNEFFDNKEKIIKAYSLLKDDQSQSVFVRDLFFKVFVKLIGTKLAYQLCDIRTDEEITVMSVDYYANFKPIEFSKNVLKKYKQYGGSDFSAMRYFCAYPFLLGQYEYINKNLANPIVIRASEEDVVFDVGACFGETAMYFFKQCGCNNVHAFELSKTTWPLLIESLEHNKCLDKIKIYNFGLSDSNTQFEINAEASGNASLFKLDDNKSKELVEVKTIDSFIKETGIIPTYIKADIEGAEHAMIDGASECIKKYGPTFAISAYHKQNDIFELILKLYNLNNNYKFYLKKVDRYWETVLFATTK